MDLNFNFLVFLLALTMGNNGCKKEETNSSANDANPELVKKPEKIKKTTSPQNKKNPEKNPPQKNNGEDLLKTGRCILNTVNYFRKNGQKRNAAAKKALTRKTKKCQEHLLGFLQKRKQINKYYQIYCVLAADCIDTLNLIASQINKSPQNYDFTKLKKLLIDKYNKFALKNNDLAKIDILQPQKHYKKTRLPVRTFRDEAARFAKRLGNLTRRWHQKHSFENKKLSTWKKYPVRTKVFHLFFKAKFGDEKRYLNSISCKDGQRKNLKKGKEKSPSPNCYPIVSKTKKLVNSLNMLFKLRTKAFDQLLAKNQIEPQLEKKIKLQYKTFLKLWKAMPTPL